MESNCLIYLLFYVYCFLVLSIMCSVDEWVCNFLARRISSSSLLRSSLFHRLGVLLLFL